MTIFLVKVSFIFLVELEFLFNATSKNCKYVKDIDIDLQLD